MVWKHARLLQTLEEALWAGVRRLVKNPPNVTQTGTLLTDTVNVQPTYMMYPCA